MRDKSEIPVKELMWFATLAIDRIYNESPEARAAVIKHYGLYHYPYNKKFQYYLRRIARKTSTKNPQCKTNLKH